MQDDETENVNSGQNEKMQETIVHPISDHANTTDTSEVEAIEAIIVKTTKEDGKKSKTLNKLLHESELTRASSDTYVVGDDIGKSNEPNIVCECKPKDTGAAVPTVVSIHTPYPIVRLTEDVLSDYSRGLNASTEDMRNIKDAIENEVSIRQVDLTVTSQPGNSTISNNRGMEQPYNASESRFTVVVHPVFSLDVSSSGNTPITEETSETISLRDNLQQTNDNVILQSKYALQQALVEKLSKSEVKPKWQQSIRTNIESTNLTPKIPRPNTTSGLMKRNLRQVTTAQVSKNIVGRNNLQNKDKVTAIIKRPSESISTTRPAKPCSSSAFATKTFTSNVMKGNFKGEIIVSQQVNDKYVVTNAKSGKPYRGCENIRRPSMIPKPKQTSNIVQKNRTQSKINLERKDKPSDYDLVSKREGKTVKVGDESHNNPKYLSELPLDTKTIHSRMTGLQEKLKATTSVIRKRIDSKTQVLEDHEATSLKENASYVILNGTSTDRERSNIRRNDGCSIPSSASTTLKDLFSSIFELKTTAQKLSEITPLASQKVHIEKLLLNISEIQRIADALAESEGREYNRNDSDTLSAEETTIKSNKSKENRIYIKFTPLKEKHKKKDDLDQPDDNKSTAGLVVDLDSNVGEKTAMDTTLKDTDSMDGVFIPSYEPLIHNIEDEDESNGLDITITFPELNHLLSDKEDSHLSVCLSDISAEALRKLKRCPKDFTLRMDFVQGKVHFQSGKSPMNNFAIGPDLKFIEYPVDDRKSDIISIKPSTECSYASQMISVENRDQERGTSYKSLKSTDSELFNVVNLPLLYKNHPTMTTVTRSCIALKNEKIISMAILARQFFKSMPQIPRLTDIDEERLGESIARTGFQVQEKKRKNRTPKKGMGSSFSNLQ